MRFADVIGNKDLTSGLVQMVDNGRLPHAVLLSEDGPWGAMPVALALAQYVNCKAKGGDSCGECPSCHKYEKYIHPDLHFVFPVSSAKKLSEAEKKAPVSDFFLKEWRELLLANPYFGEREFYDAIGIDDKSGNISVHEARSIFSKLSLRAFEGEYKTMIIYLPEKMNQEASNKLLKLLEEPPLGTLFILISHSPEKIIGTIRSRCQLLRLSPLSADERLKAGIGSSFNSEYNEIITRLLDMSLKKSLIDIFPVWEAVAGMGREKQREWCIYAENYIRKIYMVASSLESISELSEEEAADVGRYASALKGSFYEKAAGALDTAMASVDSNVNAKLIFCNLCNIIFLSA